MELPDREVLDYRPGQFLTLDLPISERRRERWRSYSIAAAPDGSNQAELCIVRLPKGKGTGFLFYDAEIGTEVLTKDPAGVFTLPEGPLTNDVVMVCTGTGVAPFRAMIQQRLRTEKVNFHLIFGCRTRKDILYLAEFADLAERFDNFRYTVALSREEGKPVAGAEFATGYVHPVYEQEYADLPENVKFYLCGWAVMVDEAKDRLLKMGFKPEQVVEELYG